MEFNLSNHEQVSGYLPIQKVKEFIRLLKEHKRFKQLGGELAKELGIGDAQTIQKIQLMFTEILLDMDKLAGEKLNGI